ncbi:efflux RND transporter permease subunit [Stappia sp. ES.058]|uniref:efflux RND transporter permease subunit n=1 Tax=Stappia sp. ES.058 TaxID=1881061 RepID=UPI00087A5CA1|nr:efflux RND transporter permease subunit [Stappia sp. ES.058]SDT93504.1 AcrB/AcrD/AcrF family protein [Stappia sp. ES.058]
MRAPQFKPSTLIGHFLRHPNAANLVMVLMILFGVFGIAKLNTEFFPQIVVNTVSVSVSWPGASAEDVEKNILQAIEPELRFIDNVDEMKSYAREGSASVRLEFLESADMQRALSDVDQAIAGVTTLPEDSETPVVSLSSWFDRVARVALRGPFSEDALKSYARQIRDDLIDRGVDKVTFSGFRDTEYVVRVPERELRRLGLTVADISDRVAANTRDLPSGDLRGGVERQVRAVADTDSPEAISRITVKSFPTGEKVQLRDIAEVTKSFDDDQVLGFSDGVRAVELTVQRSAKADQLKVNAILDRYLTEVAPKLPNSLELVKYEVRADSLNQRIMILIENGLSGLLLVVIVLFAFLNARIALWVAAGIPVAILATVGIMWVSGQTINMISLFALIMTLGIIVDDAIVVGEHTATRTAMGDSPYQAAEEGASRMLWPIIAASSTTIAAFLPIMLIQDTIGQIMGALPLVVVAVVIASIVECFFVLPGHLAHSLSRVPSWSWWRVVVLAAAPALFVIALAGREDISVPPWLDWIAVPARAGHDAFGQTIFDGLVLLFAFAVAVALEFLFLVLRRMQGRQTFDERPGWFRRGFDAGFGWVRDVPFRALVTLAYRWRYVTISVAIATLLITVGMVRGDRVGFVFFPSPEAENIRASISFNAGISLAESEAGLLRIEGALREAERRLTSGTDEKLIIASYATLGQSGNNRGRNVASIDVQLTASEERTTRTPEVVRAWRQALPDIPGAKRVAVFERRGGPPGRDLDILLQGDDPARLKEASLEVQELLTSYPGVDGVADDLPYGKPELVIELSPRGKALGFTVENAARQIRSALEGSIPRRFAQGEEEVTIRVLQDLSASGGGALRNLMLKAPSGEFVPLLEVVTLDDRQGFSVIQRVDGRITVGVSADVDREVTSNIQIVEDLNSGKIQAITDRFGIDYKFSGREEERKGAFADLQLGTIAALAAIYLILAAIFASYFTPLAVMSIIPFGVVGAVTGHYLLDFDLTILSLIGLLGLSGILVNNSIILVARFDERRKDGETIEQAAIASAQDRLRAVLLTSLTTIGGLLPLLFEKSLQAQFLMPMAITIVFGLSTATVLVLVLVPALMGIGSDISGLFRISSDEGDGAEDPPSVRNVPAE